MRLQIIIAFLLILTSYNAKSQNTIPGYSDSDVQALQLFFAQTDGTNTNGQKMNPTYSSTDASTWTGITWDLSSPKRVTKIDFQSKNMFGSLDCSGLDNLYFLNCSSNKLNALDVSTNTALSTLICSDNQLNALNVSKNTALTYLNCGINQLTALDVSTNTNLINLDCASNKLTVLDVSTNTALTSLYCGSNQLPNLNVIPNINLTTLDCSNNPLLTIDVSKNTALTNLYCSNDQLSTLNVSTNTALTYLNCDQNQLSTLDIATNTALTTLSCNQNQLTALNVGANTALTNLYCYRNQLTALDISTNKALTLLYCYTNQLTALNVGANTALTQLYCEVNQIKSLDVSTNTALTQLNLAMNQISTLDVGANTALTYLNCSTNQISTLNVSTNTALTYLNCSTNHLTALDASTNTALNQFYLDNNNMKFSDIKYNSGISILTESPQTPFIPIGLDTLGGTMAVATGGIINLTAETNIDPTRLSPDNTTFHVWKKEWSGVITEVTAQCTFSGNGGSIQLPSTAGEMDSVFITMSNPTYPDFVEQTTPATALGSGMRTRTFALVGAAFLPIELLSFTATLNNNKVDLAWSTASEKNNAFFTVEHSINNQNWENIAKVDGAGNSNTQLNYSTIDENPLSGVSYYRLKQTDFDGKFEYSKTVVIDRNAKTAIELYPNPANNEISLTGNEEDLSSVRIYNSLGQDVTKYTNYRVSNTKQIKIDISKLTTGIYILKTKNTTNRLIVN